VRVKRSVKMSQSLPVSGKALAPRSALQDLGFGESKASGEQDGKARAPGDSETRMAIKSKNRQQQGQQHAADESKSEEGQGKQEGGVQDREAQVLASLQRQVQQLQADLAARAGENSKLSEQLRRREDEWLRVSRQVWSYACVCVCV
jgi:hypothetical protein